MFIGEWHANSAAAHLDSGLAAHIGELVGTIHVIEDVAAGDIHLGVAPHLARNWVPMRFIVTWIIARDIGEPSRATAKHIAEPRLTVFRIAAVTQIRWVEGGVRSFINPMGRSTQTVLVGHQRIKRVEELSGVV